MNILLEILILVDSSNRYFLLTNYTFFLLQELIGYSKKRKVNEYY